MVAVFKSLFAVLVAASHAELARQVQYLKVENALLRAKLPGATIDPASSPVDRAILPPRANHPRHPPSAFSEH